MDPVARGRMRRAGESEGGRERHYDETDPEHGTGAVHGMTPSVEVRTIRADIQVSTRSRCTAGRECGLRASQFRRFVHPCAVRVGGGRYESEPATLEVAGCALETGDQIVSLPFEDFYEAQHRDLFGAMCLIAGNRHDAEEITQEAFVTVWERWDRVERMENPAGYLYRTAMNTFRMRFRRAKIAARRVARSIGKSDDLDVFEARHELDRGLATLTPRQRAAIVLTELIELSSAEAGKAMGVKPATVRKLASQGREALRAAIGDVDG